MIFLKKSPSFSQVEERGLTNRRRNKHNVLRIHNGRGKIGVGSVGVTTAEVFGGKLLTHAVLSWRGVFRVGKKEMSATNVHFFYFIYF